MSPDSLFLSTRDILRLGYALGTGLTLMPNNRYNRGDVVFGKEFGDHVGDWEHNMIRFVDGHPSGIWCSQHSNSEAFKFAAVEKYGQRVCLQPPCSLEPIRWR